MLGGWKGGDVSRRYAPPPILPPQQSAPSDAAYPLCARPLPAPQAFSTYLLIAWLTSNIVFAQIVNIVSSLSWQVRWAIGWWGSGGVLTWAGALLPASRRCPLASAPKTLLALLALPLQVCTEAPSAVYGTIIKGKVNSNTAFAQAVGEIVYSAMAIVDSAASKVRGAAAWGDAARCDGVGLKNVRELAARHAGSGDPPVPLWRSPNMHVVNSTAPLPALCLCPHLQYPFGGLPNFPEAYPILLSGNAQSNSTIGQSVTVLAQSTEVFSSLPSALPTFDQWLNYSAGININQTIEVRGQGRMGVVVMVAAGGAIHVLCLLARTRL